MKEKAYCFGKGGRLVGVLSEPDDRGHGVAKPALLFANTGISHRVGPFRLNVELARRAAAMGLFGFRFDFSGLGDSSAGADDQDDYQRAVVEAKLAMDLVHKRTGVTRFVWFGLCSSADKGHVIALSDPRIVGAVFIDGYAHPTPWFHVLRWTKRLLEHKRRRVWLKKRLTPAPKGLPAPYKAAIASPPPAKVEGELLVLAERGVEQLHLFTISTDYVYNYARQFYDLYPRLKGHARVQTERYPEADHTLSFRALQLLFIDRVCRWLERF